MALTKPKLSQNIDTDISVFSDPILVLHQGSSTADIDVGFLMNRSNGLTSNAAVIWQESSKSFVHILTNSSGVANSNLAVQSYANVSVGNVLLINNAGIYVDGTLGSAGQVLASDGTKSYWAPPGGFTGGTVSGKTVFESNLVVSNTTASTSNVTGALVVLGGVGIVGNLYANVFYTADGIRWAGNGAVFASGGGSAALDTVDFGLIIDSPTETSNLGLVTEIATIEADYGSVVAEVYGVINGNVISINSIPGNRLLSTTDITVANVTATDSVIADAIASNYITAGNIDVVTLTTTGTANVGSGSGNVITASGDVVVTGNLVIKNTLIGGGTAAGGVVPPGGIIMWSGSQASIPLGWYLCNGSNGTPDLRDKFIVGAGSAYAVGAVGGSKDAVVVSHTHTATVSDPGHFHNSPTGDEFKYYGNSGIVGNGPSGLRTTDTLGITETKTTGISVSNSTEGVSATNANLPPYYALCFIMKS